MTIFPATPILGLRLTFPPWQQPSPSHLLSLSPSPISGELFCQLSAAASTHVKGRLEDRGMGGGGAVWVRMLGNLGSSSWGAQSPAVLVPLWARTLRMRDACCIKGQIATAAIS